MSRKKKEEVPQNTDEVKKAILGYIQKHGWDVRQQYNLEDMRLEEDPVRLVLVSPKEITTDDFKKLTYKEVLIPVEIVVVKPEEKAPFIIEEKGKENSDDGIYHHEFSDESKKALEIKEVVTPNMKEKQTGGRENSFKAWKKRHRINYSGG